MHLTPLVTFALLLVVGMPAILVVCYGFHLMFEAPFLRAAVTRRCGDAGRRRNLQEPRPDCASRARAAALAASGVRRKSGAAGPAAVPATQAFR